MSRGLPSPGLQRTRPSRRDCRRPPSWAGSLSLVGVIRPATTLWLRRPPTRLLTHVRRTRHPRSLQPSSVIGSRRHRTRSFIIMATKRTVSQKEHIEYHKDGSVWAKGQTANGVYVGYWEWFRLDGTRMRSGHLENGEQAGEWTTYDKKGQIYKVTKIKPKAKKDA